MRYDRGSWGSSWKAPVDLDGMLMIPFGFPAARLDESGTNRTLHAHPPLLEVHPVSAFPSDCACLTPRTAAWDLGGDAPARSVSISTCSSTHDQTPTSSAARLDPPDPRPLAMASSTAEKDWMEPGNRLAEDVAALVLRRLHDEYPCMFVDSIKAIGDNCRDMIVRGVTGQ